MNIITPFIHARYPLCVLLLMMGLTGCVDLKQKSQPITYYTLDYDSITGPKFMMAEKPIIKIRRFSAAPPYDSTRIIYQPTANTQQHYVIHQWREAPATQVTHLLSRDIRDSTMFHGVVDAYSPVAADYELSGIVERCLEVNNGDTWEAHWRIVINLSATRTTAKGPAGLISQRVFELKTPITSKSALGTTQAFSKGLKEISQNMLIHLSTPHKATPPSPKKSKDNTGKQ